MNQSYFHILTLVFKHEYFEDGFFRSLEISYAEETKKLLRDLDLIVKPFKGGFHLLSARPELLQMNTDYDQLQFFISCSDPYYINYTVLPSYKPANSLVYINNLEVVSETETGELWLHEDENVKKDNIFRLAHGQFNIESYEPNIIYTFKNASNEVLSNQSVTIVDAVVGRVAISNLSQGIVCVYDGKTLVDAVYHYPNAVWKKPIGTIEIFTQALAKHCDIKEIDDNGIKKIQYEKVNYAIKFDNQKTYWKYFLVSEEYQRYDDLTIINSAREQIFDSETDNNESLVFTSKQTLPLSEHSTDTFQLVNNFVPSERSEMVILKNLVKPSPEQIYSDQIDSEHTEPMEKLYSHIYL